MEWRGLLVKLIPALCFSIYSPVGRTFKFLDLTWPYFLNMVYVGAMVKKYLNLYSRLLAAMLPLWRREQPGPCWSAVSRSCQHVVRDAAEKQLTLLKDTGYTEHLPPPALLRLALYLNIATTSPRNVDGEKKTRVVPYFYLFSYNLKAIALSECIYVFTMTWNFPHFCLSCGKKGRHVSYHIEILLVVVKLALSIICR